MKEKMNAKLYNIGYKKHKISNFRRTNVGELIGECIRSRIHILIIIYA